ncbi:hypothetical protein DDE82_007354 [Stemphylium lycopersici]|uniref:Uncharacterized protein n=1 Tax=Stemphylium lycopersici TaxID=183478 RepID=A0A364MTA3_STELY|nr:hypothetical protein TW65_03952 [Stemphylium lycopersici]RAR00352.1 hypothetical protein DDE82_007354 [Stemphylium lycopersici]RAR01908.1 hypothetical protein DDE83_008756 [Stemphylium lycopersici]
MSTQNTMIEKTGSQILAEEQVARLTKLPAPPQTPDALDSGIVKLFTTANFGGASFTVDTEDYASDQRHRLLTEAYNKAFWISWNLPVGTVMTMAEIDKIYEKDLSLADLRGCGRTVDLVGTGKTEAVDLAKMYANSCLKGFWWREVDLSMGAVELFDSGLSANEQDITYTRQTMFLSEWAPGTIHSFNLWYMNDRISAARWHTLLDRQTFTLFENYNGTGYAFNNIRAWGKTKEVYNLHHINHGNNLSAFSWTSVSPVKEKIDPITIAHDRSTCSMLYNEKKGVNYSTQAQPSKITLMEPATQEITVESTDSTVTSVTAHLQSTVGAGCENKESYDVQWTLSVSHSWDDASLKSKTYTHAEALTFEEPLYISPRSRYVAKLYVPVRKLVHEEYKTKATRWYKQRLSGCVQDGNLYKRDEIVTVRVNGTLHYSPEMIWHETRLDR